MYHMHNVLYPVPSCRNCPTTLVPRPSLVLTMRRFVHMHTSYTCRYWSTSLWVSLFPSISSQEPYLDGISYNCIAPGKRFVTDLVTVVTCDGVLLLLSLLPSLTLFPPPPLSSSGTVPWITCQEVRRQWLHWLSCLPFTGQYCI